MATLIIQNGASAGRSIEVPPAGFVVGRETGNGCDLGLGGRSVSGRHARIYFDTAQGAWLIRDLGSVNGTSVDGQRVDLATLKDGSSVRFADVDAGFSLSAPAPGASPPRPAPMAAPRASSAFPPSAGESDLLKQVRSNAAFLKSISQGSDIYIEKLEAAVRELRASVGMKDPAQGFLTVARIVESGELEDWLADLKGIREAEDNVLANMTDLLKPGGG